MPLRLKIRNDIRWCSTLEMLRRHTKLLDFIISLGNAEVNALYPLLAAERCVINLMEKLANLDAVRK